MAREGTGGWFVFADTLDDDLTWATFTQYVRGQLVINDGQTYVARDVHDSGPSFDSSRWIAIGGSGGGGVTQLLAGTGISLDPSDGEGVVTVTNIGVTQLLAGTGVSLDPSDGEGVVTVNATGGGELRGHGSPVGVVTPSEIGVQYVDEDSGVQWTSTGVADTDWVQVGDQGETCDNGGFLGAHAEGNGTAVDGLYGHAEGFQTTAEGGDAPHAEGYQTTASGQGAHSEGSGTSAGGKGAHAEGESTIADGEASHAEGSGSAAHGLASHAEGFSQAVAEGGHSEGVALAYTLGQHAESGGQIAKLGDSQFSRVTNGVATVGAQSHHIPASGVFLAFASASPSTADYTRTCLVNLFVVARRTDTPGTDSAWTAQGVVRGDGSGAYSWIGGVPTFTLVAQDAAASGWSVLVNAPSANDMQIEVTSDTAGATVHWTGVAELYEVQG